MASRMHRVFPPSCLDNIHAKLGLFCGENMLNAWFWDFPGNLCLFQKNFSRNSPGGSGRLRASFWDFPGNFCLFQKFFSQNSPGGSGRLRAAPGGSGRTPHLQAPKNLRAASGGSGRCRCLVIRQGKTTFAFGKGCFWQTLTASGTTAHESCRYASGQQRT